MQTCIRLNRVWCGPYWYPSPRLLVSGLWSLVSGSLGLSVSGLSVSGSLGLSVSGLSVSRSLVLSVSGVSGLVSGSTMFLWLI